MGLLLSVRSRNLSLTRPSKNTDDEEDGARPNYAESSPSQSECEVYSSEDDDNEEEVEDSEGSLADFIVKPGDGNVKDIDDYHSEDEDYICAEMDKMGDLFKTRRTQPKRKRTALGKRLAQAPSSCLAHFSCT